MLFGLDNNLLSRANDANLFEPYESPGLATVDSQYQLDPDHRVTPIDRGDVCLNFDREYFTAHQLAVPQSLDDLTKPEYKGLLVVENPSDVDARAGLPPRNRGPVRSGRLAGLLAAAEGQRRDGVGRVGAGVLRPVLRR